MLGRREGNKPILKRVDVKKEKKPFFILSDHSDGPSRLGQRSEDSKETIKIFIKWKLPERTKEGEPS